MASRKSTGLFACATFLAAALLSGCGGTSTSQTIPTTVTTAYAHSLIFRNHSAMTAGYNAFGQLGLGVLSNNSPTFAIVPGLGVGHFDDGATGAVHTLVFSNSSTARSWGYNAYGQLGNTATIPTGTNAYSATPVPVHFQNLTSGFGPGAAVTKVAAGGFHSLAVVGGKVYGWGFNLYGQVGDGTFTNQGIPVLVVDPVNGTHRLDRAVEVAAGGYHSLALRSDGTIYAWGQNLYGQLGIDPTLTANLSRQTPVPVAGFITTTTGTSTKSVEHIYAAGSYNLALEVTRDNTGAITDQTLWGWGYNGSGQLGKDPATQFSFTPVPILITTSTDPLVIKKVSAGLDHVLILLGSRASQDVPDGTWKVRAIGFNFNGQLGNTGGALPTVNFVSSLVDVVGLQTTATTFITDIKAFGNQSMARIGTNNPTDIGTWYGWGDNTQGQLGNPVVTTSLGSLLQPTLMQGYRP